MPEFGGKKYGYDAKGLKQLEEDKASVRATRREKRARPGAITTTERKTIYSGDLPTSEQQMSTRYPQFDAQANPTEMGAVAAQRAAAGQGQGIVPGPQIDDVPPASLEQLLQRLMSSAEQGQKPVQRKPMQDPRTMTPPVLTGPPPPSMGIPSPERGNEIQRLTPLGAGGRGAPDLAEIIRRITGAQQTRP